MIEKVASPVPSRSTTKLAFLKLCSDYVQPKSEFLACSDGMQIDFS